MGVKDEGREGICQHLPTSAGPRQKAQVNQGKRLLKLMATEEEGWEGRARAPGPVGYCEGAEGEKRRQGLGCHMKELRPSVLQVPG